jgi:integrase
MAEISTQKGPPANAANTRTRRPRRKVLTDAMVAALPRRPQPYFHPDPELPKHGIRVRPSGPGAYTVITRDPFGKQRWTKIGSTAEKTIGEAREVARIVIARVEQGLPAFEAPAPKADSVAVVTAEWLTRHAYKNGLRRAADYERIINVYILPHWRDRAFVELKRSDAAKLLDYVEDRHGPAMADQVLSILRMAGSYVRDRSDDYVPPFTGIKSRTPQQHRKRDRVLSDEEIRAIWLAADQAGTFGALVQMLLLTAQRLDKVRTMRHIDVSADGVWTIRTEAREKGNAGQLPLPQLALKIIARRPRFVTNDFVFAGNKGAITNVQAAKVALEKQSATSGWRIHDLRRTARSLMSRAHVAPHIAERSLGHALGPIEQVYDRHPFTAEKGAALRRLASLIERIVLGPPGGNVVELHEAAGS